MKIALFPKTETEKNLEITQKVIDFLTQKGVMVFVDEKHASTFDLPSIEQADLDEVQFFISMGGDGTILRLMHHYENFRIPVIGINLGHLGFMADIPASDIYSSLTDLLEGAYEVEERLVLKASHQKKENFAVNDVVIHRANNPNLVEISIKVEGKHVNTFEADGLILSTPNGSTAYSLAAGGPIIMPSLSAVVLTPICPHTISNRPIVIPAGHEIEIQYLTSGEPVDVIVDGLPFTSLNPSDTFKITKYPEPFRMVSLARHDYFATLRTKLGWVGKLR